MLNDREIQFQKRGAWSRASTLSLRMGLPSSLTPTAPARWKGAKVGQHRSLAGVSGGSDGKHVYHGAPVRLLQPGDPLRRVNDGLRVGHAAHGSKSSRGCRGRSGGDGFLVTLPGFAQVNMQVDEAGGETIRPRASNLSWAVPRVLPGGAISATSPSRSRTSMVASILAAGSISRPPLINRL